MLKPLKGPITEKLAKLYLQQQGFSIIEQNFWYKLGTRRISEIDILAEKAGVLFAIEVKSRAYLAREIISKAKMLNIHKALNHYCSTRNNTMPRGVLLLVYVFNTWHMFDMSFSS